MTVPAGAGPLPWTLLAAAAGALAGLALPPLGLPLLLWPALALLWQLIERGRRGATLLWGLTAVLTSHRWLLWLHPLDWIGVPGPLSLPLCLLIWLACGLAGGALVLLWSLPWPRLGLARSDTALLAAATWGLGEVLLARGPLFWVGLGVSPLPADRPLAGLGAIGGAGLIAAVQLLIGWCLWRLVSCRQRWRQRLAAGLVLLLGAHAVGAAALPAAAGLPGLAAGPDTLVVLQPAIPTRRKFEPAQQRQLLAQLADTLADVAAASPGQDQPQAARLSAWPPQPPAPEPADPAAWPAPRPGGVQQAALMAATAAVPAPGAGTAGITPLPPRQVPAGSLAGVAAVLLPEGALPLDQPLPRPAPVEVLSGGFRRQGEQLRSSLLRFGPGERWPSSSVDKHRLVPLGEWVPLAGLVRWSGLSAVGGLEPGPSSRLLERPGGAIGVAICYELADGQALAKATRDGAGWLLASANLDPYPALLQQQFSAVAQLRAIETGRWLVSAANTGPSLLVDPGGRLQGSLPSQRPGRARIQLPRLQRLSPYDRWGEWPLLALLALAAASRAGLRRQVLWPGAKP